MAKAFVERDLSAPFLPLDTDDAKRVLLVTLGGPNGSGKTAIWTALLPLITYAHTFTYTGIAPRVLGIAEPPPIKVCAGSDVTYRNITKSGIGIPGLVTAEDLRDQLTIARLFVKPRRKVERLLAYNFPFRNSYWEGYKINFSNPPDFISLMAWNMEQTRRVGFSIVCRDRSTETTWAFQGNDSKRGQEVRNFLIECYERKFLMRDSLTLVIMPDDPNVLISTGARDEKERDVQVRSNEYELYRKLKNERFGLPFTRRVVELSNDPTGAKNNVSAIALFALLMVLATEQEHKGELEIIENKPFNLRFPLFRFLFESEEMNDFSPSMNHTKLSSRLLLEKSSDKRTTCGDVTILEVDKETVRMIVSPK